MFEKRPKSAPLTSTVSSWGSPSQQRHIKYLFILVFRDNAAGSAGDCYLSEQVWLQKPLPDQLFSPHWAHIKAILCVTAGAIFVELPAICDFVLKTPTLPIKIMQKKLYL